MAGSDRQRGSQPLSIAEPTPTPRRCLHLEAVDRARIDRWAEAAYPEEACGILIGSDAGDIVNVEKVRSAKNLETDLAGSRYRLEPIAHLAAWREARHRGLEVVGFWHSHPDSDPEPSRHDLDQAWVGASYLIVAVRSAGGVPEAGKTRSWRLHEGRFIEETLIP